MNTRQLKASMKRDELTREYWRAEDAWLKARAAEIEAHKAFARAARRLADQDEKLRKVL